MNDSATPNRVAERKRQTAAQLTAVSRRLTVEHGITGFTIEELCAEVGVSRRTFFNYFPSKEEAIFGIDEQDEVRHVAAEFLARGSRGWAAVIEDLVDLAAEVAVVSGLSAADHALFMRVLDREPQLLARLMGLNRDREAAITALVAEREGVPLDDPHLHAAVGALVYALRAVAERLADTAVAENFGTALNDSLDALRVILELPTRKA